ncbi:MAG: hypothetical protein GWN84_18270 [Gammaproteobacteria bacterium]|nr:hypothetical protein [Gammaproteobacteria bacterium]NIR84778.1 hypothetical protein [Gammaproteobacteria bacterium]NIR91297.1 hypothetical protein [Gammaproteobacteria bacterium]NIU05825.1 hypothetical protein [Gammaproteobacteria bacterium]NIV76485.1 hypothetical protein [Gammaproteobacteria bacterium]
MQTRTIRSSYGAAAAVCLAASMASASDAAPLVTEGSVTRDETRHISDVRPTNARTRGEWRLVMRFWNSSADRHGPAHIRWVVNSYPSSLDCQHALQGRVTGIHPEVKRRSRLACVGG